MQLTNVAAPVTHGQLLLSNIFLQAGLRFQIGASLFRIEQLLENDAVLAKGVYGARKGDETLIVKGTDTRAILDRLNK